MSRRLVSLLIAMVSFYPVAQAAAQNDADKAIDTFLSSQKTGNESAEAEGSAVVDLNGDNQPEIVLVWVLLGPTYSHHTLTVFTRTAAGRYKPAASLQLTGEAKLSSTKDGIIFLDQNVFAKNDPLCCPSIKKRMKYRWLGRKISQLK